MYILQHVSVIRGHQVFLHQAPLCFLLLLDWPVFTIMEVEGVVCPLVYIFINDELLTLLKLTVRL
jgi:hypothetical protein